MGFWKSGILGKLDSGKSGFLGKGIQGKRNSVKMGFSGNGMLEEQDFESMRNWDLGRKEWDLGEIGILENLYLGISEFRKIRILGNQDF